MNKQVIRKINKNKMENKMRNIKLTIEYDGKDFNGWQKQPSHIPAHPLP